MKTRNYYFDLPPELIAQKPLPRGRSRLLVYSRNTGQTAHEQVHRLPDILSPDTLIVLNNSAVRRARVYARADAGTAQVEFVFLQPLQRFGEDFQPIAQALPGRYWRVMVSRAKRQTPGRGYTLPGGLRAEIAASVGALRILKLDRSIGEDYFNKYGHVPLPPYIRRAENSADAARYQTVFASKIGSAAAPTAGLHLNQALLQQLETRGIRRCELTLHVGLGTFLPVRSENILDHEMHSEDYEISQETADQITLQKHKGSPVLAVGTTALRSLESAWDSSSGRIVPGRASTDLFIYPGYKFKVVDALFTNFHTPESTLLMLVSAFVGRETILSLYGEAIRQKYRFFSYGDACLFL